MSKKSTLCQKFVHLCFYFTTYYCTQQNIRYFRFRNVIKIKIVQYLEAGVSFQKKTHIFMSKAFEFYRFIENSNASGKITDTFCRQDTKALYVEVRVKFQDEQEKAFYARLVCEFHRCLLFRPLLFIVRGVITPCVLSVSFQIFPHPSTSWFMRLASF